MEEKQEAPKTEPLFTRAFRWVLTPKEAGYEIHDWCVKVHVDYKYKQISADFIDDAKGQVFAWLDSIKGPNAKLDLVITHYDGYGRPVNAVEFAGCELLAHTSNYSYGNSEPLLNAVMFSYKKVTRRNGLHIQ